MSAVAAPTAASRRVSTSRKHENEGNPELNYTQIGQYTFLRKLGEGNFAQVRLAKHSLTSQEVAIKIIDKTKLDEKKLSKLHREVRIMKRRRRESLLLNHPNIVKLYEVIETRNTLFLVMEHVSGGELYDYLVAHGRMKEKEARAKFRQIVSAVSYCHQKRVIHRDLKAENLLLDENLNIKIADFGFSNNYQPDGQLDTFCGSPPYAAPELFQGQKYTGPEVDVWSLGVILYVLSTGCLPFDGKDLKEMREVVCRGRYKVPFYLSDGCEKLLRKFLVRDSTKRATLDIVANDPWLNDGYTEPATYQGAAPVAGQDDRMSEPIDEDICRFVTTKFNIPYDQIVASLKNGTYDDISAIYYLLADQRTAGKWNPTATSVLSPISPLTTTNFQQGTATPASKPSAMGTIGEDGAPPTTFIQPPPSAQNASERRARATTVGAGTSRQRPVTWMAANNAQAQHAVEEKVAANGQEAVQSGAELDSTTSGAAGSSAHTRQSTVPATAESSSPKTGGGVLNTLRNLGRRLSESTGGRPNAAALATGNGDEKPRAVRFSFNSSTISSKPADEIVRELNVALQRLGLKFQSTGRFSVESMWFFRQQPLQSDNVPARLDVSALQSAIQEVVEGGDGAANANVANGGDIKDAVRFEIEVCEVPQLRNVHGLRFKRLNGPASEYKDVCGKILQTVRL